MEMKLRTERADLQGAQRLGWIGAGKMGAPMIENLLKNGVSVAVSEPVASVVDDLVSKGASIAAAPAAHAGSGIVFSTLPNDAVLLEVVFGGVSNAGLASSLQPGSVFVEMSTVSPDCSTKVASALTDKGVHYLRAPLSGSTALAEKAQLTVLASGDEIAWKAAQPYLEMLSSKRFYLGSGEEARYMKLVLNTLVGATSAVLAEALALGASGGLSHADMMDVICESAVASPLMKYKTDAVVSGDYTPAFTVTQMIKDFALISDAARQKNVPLFTTGLILELYRAASNAGLNNDDFFALVKWHSMMSNK